MTTDRKSKWGSRLLAIAGIVLIVGPIVLSLLYVSLWHKVDNNAEVAYVTQCDTGNETRTAVGDIVDKLALRGRIGAAANVSAPNQTAKQRAATLKNLKLINDLQDFAHTKLEQKSCVYPPVPTTTTTTTSPARPPAPPKRPVGPSTTQFPIKVPAA